MYNLDAYISDFLSDNKKLSAQGLGEFIIVTGQAPNGAPVVEFVSNKNVYTSEGLISFIAEHQGKNKIVTGFDVESHLNQIKQFINIGTPWIIPGLGQLQLNKSRELEFSQQVPGENALHERSKSKQAAAEANYQTYNVSNSATARTSNMGTIVLTLFIILALGAGGYYFYANSSSLTSSATSRKDTAATVTDTVVSVPSSPNTTAVVTAPPPQATTIIKPSENATVVSSSAGIAGFRFVLNKTVNPVYASKRFSQLKTYGTKVYMDSVKKDNYTLYKIYLIQDASPSDTAKLRDSLTRYYGKPVKIEAQ